MALTPLEKIKIQKELKETKAALSAATNPLQKLKLQKQRKQLWVQLKGSMASPAPVDVADEDLPGEIGKVNVGFHGVDGVKHPQWALSDSHYEPVYSNLKDRYALVWRITPDVSDNEIYILHKSEHSRMINRSFTAVREEGKTYRLNDVIKPNGLKSQANPKERAKYKRALSKAMQALESRFPMEVDGFTIAPESFGYKAKSESGLYVAPGKHLHSVISDIQSGAAQASIDAHAADTRAELDKNYQDFKNRSLQVNRLATAEDLKQFFELADIGPDGNLAAMPELIEGLTAQGVKITGSLFNEVEDAIRIVRSWDFQTGAALTYELVQNEKLKQDASAVEPETVNSVDPMLEEYREGKFNNQGAESFKDTMRQVFDLGMPLNDVGSGMVEWFKANPDQLAA